MGFKRCRACLLGLVVVLSSNFWLSCRAKDNPRDHLSENIDPIVAAQDDFNQLVNMPGDVRSQILTYPGYMVSFNSEHHQPNWVAWELTRDEALANSASRRDGSFAPDADATGCASLSDYRNSGYTRGHMCPAADMKWSKEAMAACFKLTNICPQAADLNAGAWNTLEEKSRQWAIRDSAIIIICGPILSDQLNSTIGDSHVSVPERFFKVLLAPYANPPRAIGFIMPNGRVTGGMNVTALSVDQVEEVTGFDFFGFLPDDIENAIEQECNLPRWNSK